MGYDSIAYAAWKNEQEHQNYLGQDEKDKYADRAYDLGKTKDSLNSIPAQNNFLYIKELNTPENPWKNIPLISTKIMLNLLKPTLNPIAAQNDFLYIKELNTPENPWKNLPLISMPIMLNYLKPKGWIVPWNSTISEHQIDQKKAF